jgi:hypothetical protein
METSLGTASEGVKPVANTLRLSSLKPPVHE